MGSAHYNPQIEVIWQKSNESTIRQKTVCQLVVSPHMNHDQNMVNGLCMVIHPTTVILIMGIQIPSNKLITIPQCGKTIQPIDHGSWKPWFLWTSYIIEVLLISVDPSWFSQKNRHLLRDSRDPIFPSSSHPFVLPRWRVQRCDSCRWNPQNPGSRPRDFTGDGEFMVI